MIIEIYSTFGIDKPALPADSLRPTQFRLSAPKARYGRPGNSLALKPSGPLILRRAQGALKLIADAAQAVGRQRLISLLYRNPKVEKFTNVHASPSKIARLCS